MSLPIMHTHRANTLAARPKIKVYIRITIFYSKVQVTSSCRQYVISCKIS